MTDATFIRAVSGRLAIALATGLLSAVGLAGAPGPDGPRTIESAAIPVELPTTANEGLPLNEFTIKYRLRYAAFSAELTLGLRRLHEADAANLFEATATTRARGMAKLFVRDDLYERARFSLVAGRILPRHYVLDSGKKAGEDSGEVSFDWEQMTADSLYEGKRSELTLDADVYDRISADIVVITDLRQGRQPRNLRIAEKNQLREYVFTYQGEERVTTTAGEFDAVRYLRQRIGSSRSTMIWYARDADYLPVRMEQLKKGKTVVTSEATMVQWAD